MKTILTPLIGLFLFCVSSQAAPPIISYSGQVAVNGFPFTGTGLFKFAFVGGNGQFSYWSQDGTTAGGSEPSGYVSAWFGAPSNKPLIFPFSHRSILIFQNTNEPNEPSATIDSPLLR